MTKKCALDRLCIFLIVFLILCLQGARGFAQENEEQKPKPRKIIYVVQTGDTLWDIASRFMNSPYYWPKIWERNPFIIDPDLIYPGDVLNLYPSAEKVSVAEAEVEVVPQPGEEEVEVEREARVLLDKFGRPVKVIYKETSSMGYIEEGEFQKAGKIIKIYEDKSMVGEPDSVYVDIGTKSGVKEDDLFSVFRVEAKILHPITNKPVGYKIINLGEVKVTNLAEDSAEATIINSYQEIHEGDYIKPYVAPLSEEIDVLRSQGGLEGYIVDSKRPSTALSRGDIVYIDLGKAQGAEPGYLFDIYISGKVPKGKQGINLPDKIIGELVIIDTRENSSIALVTKSTREFERGQNIRLKAME